MASNDLYHEITSTLLLAPTDAAGAITKSKVLSMLGFRGVLFQVGFGQVTGGNGANFLYPILQESDTTQDVSFTNVAPGDLLGAFTQVTSANANTVQMVGYRGLKAYLRVITVPTGTGVTSAPATVLAVLSCGGASLPEPPQPITAN